MVLESDFEEDKRDETTISAVFLIVANTLPLLRVKHRASAVCFQR